MSRSEKEDSTAHISVKQDVVEVKREGREEKIKNLDNVRLSWSLGSFLFRSHCDRGVL